MLISEKYRPACFADVIGQDKAIRQIETVRKRGWIGKSFWLTGKSGTGKTTIARIMAAETAKPYAITEVDGQDVTLDFVREWESQIRMKPIGCDAHVLIINEAHTLRSAVVSRMLTVMESPGFVSNCLLILTTTNEGNDLFADNFDSGPFASRTINIALSQRGLADEFASRAKQIAEAEGLDGQPIEKYKRLANDCKSNLRMMLSRIESGDMMA